MAAKKKTIERDNSWIIGLTSKGVFSLRSLLNSGTFSGAVWEKRVIFYVLQNEPEQSAFMAGGRMNQIASGSIEQGGESQRVCSRGGFPAPSGYKPDLKKWDGEIGTLSIRLGQTVQFGKHVVDGVSLACERILDEKKTIQRWEYSYYPAGRDPAFRVAQYHSCLGCLRRLLTLPLIYGETEITFEQVLQSELLRAIAFDQYIYAPELLQDQLQACLDALWDPETILCKDKTYASWVLDAYFIRMERAAKASLGKQAALTDLSPDEIAREERRLVTELSRLKAMCSPPTTANPKGVNTRAIMMDAFTGRLPTLSQSQHDVLVELYKWRCENTGLRHENTKTMHHPAARWDGFASGWVSNGRSKQTNEAAQNDYSGSLSAIPNYFPV